MSTTATRLITLIMLLQRRPKQKAGDMAAELGVSVRSFHRYIAMLDEMGIPIYSERGPDGGFSLVRGYKMPPLVFTPEEAVAVYLGTGLAGEMWGHLYAEAAQGALAKLENVLPDEQRQEAAWARRSLVAAGMHRMPLEPVAEHLTVIRQALRAGQTLHMHYRRRGDSDGTQRAVDPYALVHRYGWWYVVGHCHLRRAIRSFRLDRIEALSLAAGRFQVPADFDVHAYLNADMDAATAVHVRMQFLPPGAFLAREQRNHWDDLQEQPDGSILVRFTAPDMAWAASTVLSYGGLAVALDPPELRQTVRTWAAAMVAQYPAGA